MIRIAIPSYRRAHTLKSKTLAWLDSLGIEPQRIDVFVASHEEAEEYMRVLNAGSYGRIIVGEKGMGAIRRFIAQFYAPGTKILNVDDDIKRVVVRLDEKRLVDLHNLDDEVQSAFDLCDQTGLRLWGVYPVKNPYFMKAATTFDLRYINGTLWGSYAGDASLQVTLDDKEDFERTIRSYLAHGGVVRLNYLACDTNFYGEPGGMQEDRSPDTIAAGARDLVKLYPSLCSLNVSKKSEHVEVRLKDRR